MEIKGLLYSYIPSRPSGRDKHVIPSHVPMLSLSDSTTEGSRIVLYNIYRNSLNFSILDVSMVSYRRKEVVRSTALRYPSPFYFILKVIIILYFQVLSS